MFRAEAWNPETVEGIYEETGICPYSLLVSCIKESAKVDALTMGAVSLVDEQTGEDLEVIAFFSHEAGSEDIVVSNTKSTYTAITMRRIHEN